MRSSSAKSQLEPQAAPTLRTTLDRWWYPHHENHWSAKRFRQDILELLDPRVRLLDLGAGRGASPLMNFRGLAREVVGADIDVGVLQNPYLDKRVHSPTLEPFEDNAFNVIVCKDVLEHVEHPRRFFAEVARVLAPGGHFLAMTPNRNHYVALFARLTPLAFHKVYNRMRGRKDQDTFGTFYRANTFAQIRRLAGEAGLDVVSLQTAEGRPSYLRINPALYLGGMVYERLVNGLGLDEFKAVMYVKLRKPALPNSIVV